MNMIQAPVSGGKMSKESTNMIQAHVSGGQVSVEKHFKTNKWYSKWIIKCRF